MLINEIVSNHLMHCISNKAKTNKILERPPYYATNHSCILTMKIKMVYVRERDR